MREPFKPHGGEVGSYPVRGTTPASRVADRPNPPQAISETNGPACYPKPNGSRYSRACSSSHARKTANAAWSALCSG